MSRGQRSIADQIIEVFREVEIKSVKARRVRKGARVCGIKEQSYYRWRKE
jgi:hypothetical protein